MIYLILVDTFPIHLEGPFGPSCRPLSASDQTVTIPPGDESHDDALGGGSISGGLRTARRRLGTARRQGDTATIPEAPSQPPRDSAAASALTTPSP